MRTLARRILAIAVPGSRRYDAKRQLWTSARPSEASTGVMSARTSRQARPARPQSGAVSAALLTDQLDLVAVPRNLAKPDGSANFGLDSPSDARFSDWMEQRLLLATWIKPAAATLDDVETAVVRQLRPPLNLDKVGESRERLRETRERMACVV
jgi:hypothetical protein